MFPLRELHIIGSVEQLQALPEGKLLINTINAHSFNTAQKDPLFARALREGGALIADGASIVWAAGFLGMRERPRKRIAGWDLFAFEMNKLNVKGGRCMFMGSSEKVLALIVEKAKSVYPNIEVVTFSPPYKKDFSEDENTLIVEAINKAQPDLLWIGMTAPKQEKWAFANWQRLNISCHTGTVGAVFDFFAGTTQRAPLFWQRHGLEWAYRLLKEPRRMWRRYLVGNALFLFNVLREKCS